MGPFIMLDNNWEKFYANKKKLNNPIKKMFIWKRMGFKKNY